MGTLIGGVWTDEAAAKSATKDGRYRRAESSFRNWITPDGSRGPAGDGGFAAEAGRLPPFCRHQLSVGPSHDDRAHA